MGLWLKGTILDADEMRLWWEPLAPWGIEVGVVGAKVTKGTALLQFGVFVFCCVMTAIVLTTI